MVLGQFLVSTSLFSSFPGCFFKWAGKIRLNEHDENLGTGFQFFLTAFVLGDIATRVLMLVGVPILKRALFLPVAIIQGVFFLSMAQLLAG